MFIGTKIHSKIELKFSKFKANSWLFLMRLSFFFSHKRILLCHCADDEKTLSYRWSIC